MKKDNGLVVTIIVLAFCYFVSFLSLAVDTPFIKFLLLIVNLISIAYVSCLLSSFVSKVVIPLLQVMLPRKRISTNAVEWVLTIIIFGAFAYYAYVNW